MNYEKICKNKWVVQGFNSCLCYIRHGPLSSIKYCHDFLGYGYTEQLFIFDKEYLDYHYLEEDFINVGNEFYKRWIKDKDYFNKLLKKNNELNKTNFDVNDKISIINISSLKNEELFYWFHLIIESYTKPIGISHVLESISYVFEPMIREKLSNEIKLDINSKKFKELFSNLLQPSKASWVTEESLDLLYITKEIFNDDKLKQLFNKDVEEIWKALSNEIKKIISSHRKKYFYNQLNYIHAEGLTDLDYVKEIKEFILDNIDLDSRINEHLIRYDKNNQIRKEIINKYNLSDDLVHMINLIVDCLNWQDERKKEMLSSIFYLDKVLKEIANRYNAPIEILKNFSWNEINHETLSKFDYEKEKRRLNKMIVYFSRENNKLKEEFIFDNDYDNFMKLYSKEKIEDKQLHGNAASLGKVIGKVRICKTKEDILNFQKDEILVAKMTRPDFVPAMKKAKAIITDEGGITSHAAIVSRELGIPCIIGTKNATIILKNGMSVEVNANHGFVKIVD
jgi:phosphohistidine swiveling domain-containing protein